MNYLKRVNIGANRKVAKFPIVLVGRDYWSGLMDWLQNHAGFPVLYKQSGFDLLHLVDTADEAAHYC